MNKNIAIKLNNDTLKIVDASGATFVDIYIPEMFTLMHVDSRDKDIDYLGDIIEDISNKKVIIKSYTLMGKIVYDFDIANGATWKDYPRSEAITKSIIKKIGKTKIIGYLEICE